MLDEPTRQAVLRLRDAGHGTRTIARALRISRGAVQDVLASGTATVPIPARPSRIQPHRDAVVDLWARCGGNLVRVHEELTASGIALSYPALTAFCRRAGIGHEAPRPSGRYHFEPGQEMQHDTSPHFAKIADTRVSVQTASLVLCHSRLLYFQHYPRFTRYHCKLFLTDALTYVGGSCADCMIDNTHVVVLEGTGETMVPAPEMAAFAERFRFTFKAHEKGDANRSARVERPFHFIENNFLAGRTFASFADLNAQAVAFCDRVNSTRKRHLDAAPRDLFAAERTLLRPLPLHIPEVYRLHHRIVDVEGYVSVNAHRYSVPYTLIGRRVEVRETRDAIEVFLGPRRIAAHVAPALSGSTRVTQPEHRPSRTARTPRPNPDDEAFRGCPDILRAYVEAVRKRLPPLRATLTLRRLAALRRDYPEAPFLSAIHTATTYGLFDVERLERLILRTTSTEYFKLDAQENDDEPQED